MKKILALLISAAVLSAPALAGPHRHHFHVPHAAVSMDALDVLFKYDADKDHALSESELEAYKKDGLKFADAIKASVKTLAEADTNKDGAVSFDEFLALSKVEPIAGFMPPPPPPHHGRHHGPKPHHGPHGGPGADGPKGHAAGDKHPPKPHDGPGDKPPHGPHHGHGGPHHGHGGPHHGHGPMGMPPVPNGMEFMEFSFFDKDHDGRLSAEEYAQFAERQKSKSENVRALFDGLNFKSLDLNQDGGVTASELGHYAVGVMLQSAPNYKDRAHRHPHGGKDKK